MRKTLHIKPLSINDNCPIKKQAYFKEIERQLPKSIKLPKGRLLIKFDFYFSNDGQDWDSAIKYTQDAIFKAWNLQDAGIYRGEVNKHIVGKGKEKIIFKIQRHKMKTLLPLTLCIIITYTLGIACGIYINEVLEAVRSMAMSNFN